jgi:hypothetical protein
LHLSLSAKSSFDRSAFEISCSRLSPLRDGFSDWEKMTAVFHPVVMSPTSQFKNLQRFRITTERICPRPGTWLTLKLLASLLDIDGFSTVADFPTDSGRPTAADIHDVPIAPAAAVISNVNFGALL